MICAADRPTRTLLADDHALVRQGPRLILEAEPDLTVVAEAGDGAEAVEQATRSGDSCLELRPRLELRAVAHALVSAWGPCTCGNGC